MDDLRFRHVRALHPEARGVRALLMLMTCDLEPPIEYAPQFESTWTAVPRDMGDPCGTLISR